MGGGGNSGAFFFVFFFRKEHFRIVRVAFLFSLCHHISGDAVSNSFSRKKKVLYFVGQELKGWRLSFYCYGDREIYEIYEFY